MFIDFFMNCMIEQKSCEKTETFTQIDTIIHEKSDEHKLIFNTHKKTKQNKKIA